jgi:hypothetical protein
MSSSRGKSGCGSTSSAVGLSGKDAPSGCVGSLETISGACVVVLVASHYQSETRIVRTSPSKSYQPLHSICS